ncbi:MAG TPA: pectinesterase family protein [Ktedonobacteraceae bacterium]|nr:pectinesterase family protein [Ktedonobacteraceae bacterium]
MRGQSFLSRSGRVVCLIVFVCALFLSLGLFLNSKPAFAASAARVLVVAQDGSGQYTTVQSAVDAIPANSTGWSLIYIKDGTYKEVVTVPANKPYISFIGQDENKTIITYDNYASKQKPDGSTYGTSGSASVFIQASHFFAYNLTFQNSAGNVGQALAVNATGDQEVFRNVRILGWQDTLYAGSGRQYYENADIEGVTDYIFGDATAFFDHCQLHNLDGWSITAQSRSSASETTGYVFNQCQITGTPSDSTILGRPWRAYARVIYLNCSMDSSIKPIGWDDWGNAANQSTAYFAEYDSTGAGADPSARATWSHQLTSSQAAQYSLNAFLNQDGWLTVTNEYVNWVLNHFQPPA